MKNEDRSNQVERLLSAQRATRVVSDSAILWWQQVADAADSAMTDDSLDGFYRLLLEAVQPVLEADEISILIADGSQSALVARTSLGLGEEAKVDLWIPAGQGMAGQVLSSKRPLVVRDLSTITLVSTTLEDQGLRSVVAVPILSGSRVIGVMHAGSKMLAHFSEDDANLLEVLAERVAIAIDRVHLLDEQRRVAHVTAFLADTARILAGAVNFAATLEELANVALPVLGDLCLIDVRTDDGQMRRVMARHKDPAQQFLADRLREEFALDLDSRHPAADVLRLGGTRWSPTMSDEFLREITTSEAHFHLTKTLGFRSYMVVPIADARETVGALTLVSCSRPLNRDDVTLAELLANHVGTIVARAKHLDEVSLTSRQLQAALLPEIPVSLPGIRLHASYSAASESLDVGGDFYDVVPTPDGPIWLVIGDIEGHDRRAAAQMGQLRSAIRTLVLHGLDPEDVIDELRRVWLFLGLTKTATLFLGQLNPSTGQLATASAGHPPPLLVSGTSAAFLATGPSPLLGRKSGLSAERYDCCIPDGGLLLLYTDGALRERTHGVDDGMARLRSVALGAASTPRNVCEQVIASVGAGDDDVALLAVMRPSEERAD